MKIENVLIFGLGAIGSIYAAKIYDYNKDAVNVLLDKSRIDRYKEKGIIFNKKRYDFNYVLDTETEFKSDLIIVATKAMNFEKTADEIKNYVGENTIIISLLNGISSEEFLASRYGAEKLIYSYFIGHSSMKKRENVTFDGVGKIVFGEKDNSVSEKVLAIKNFFETVGIKYEIADDMLSSLWQKFVVNVGVNQPLAILGMPFSVLQKSKSAREFSHLLMQEAVEVAKAEKINNTEKFIPYVEKIIDEIPPYCKPSMLQDVENKKLTEVNIFAGEIKRLGKKYGIQTPANNAAFLLLEAYNESLYS